MPLEELSRQSRRETYITYEQAGALGGTTQCTVLDPHYLCCFCLTTFWKIFPFALVVTAVQLRSNPYMSMTLLATCKSLTCAYHKTPIALLACSRRMWRVAFEDLTKTTNPRPSEVPTRRGVRRRSKYAPTCSESGVAFYATDVATIEDRMGFAVESRIGGGLECRSYERAEQSLEYVPFWHPPTQRPDQEYSRTTPL
jgi:hypothetical protein